MTEARYSMVDLICRKRDGGHLSENEIKWIISAYGKSEIPDYQMSSLLMAINFTGMTREETRFLTESMLYSGERINLSDISGVKVDKHSTGGVGDKISLILAPVMAAAGVIVPMMSGRGLGHTGGTLDKLEAIPGLTTTLSVSEFKKILNKIGFAMIGQTEKIVPADGKLYALRDVSGTVPSIPLICSSIISKKMAEGTDALVLDVKFGKGAFMQQKSKAEELANNLVALGNDCGLRTSALLTNMDEPLGYAVGNWPETKEAIETLKGKGPEDVRELVISLGSIMLVMGFKIDTIKKGRKIINDLLNSGKGYDTFLQMVDMQGGDVSVVEKPDSYKYRGKKITVISPETGYIRNINALKTGLLSVALGAGRKQKGDSVDSGAGILFLKKGGDEVRKNEPIAELYTQKKDISFQQQLIDCVSFSHSQVSERKIVYKLIETIKKTHE